MLTDTQKRLLIDQLTQFQHALIDDEVVFVEARRKADGKHVLLGCIQREMTAPPAVMGGEPLTAVHTVPVFEFIDCGDGTTVMPNPYEALDPDMVEAGAASIATGPDVLAEAANLVG